VLRLLKWFLGLSIGAALVLAAAALWWLNRPLPMAPQAASQGVVDVSIPAGSSARRVAQLVVRSGFETQPALLFLWFRLSGEGARIKAGAYEFGPGTTPMSLLDKMVRGEQALRRVTLVEGWTYWQVLQALRQAEHLKYDLPDDSPQGIMQHLGLAARHPEGRFFPDTYVYPKNATASSVLKQAAAAMDKRLAQAWAQRDPAVPLKSLEEVLIMASIIEKETGRASDRPMISSVFHNRLRIGMPLQTDPTVIYGLGAAFDGNLKRIHLRTDHPWNTYTRNGLPPTPIALPGKAALLAAVQPAQSKALYFVARGDGSSQFSDDLNAHNEAVARYQLKRSAPAPGKAQ